MALSLPTLITDRLCLRPFDLSDAKEVQRQAGNLNVAKTTLNVPHPYEDGMAESWISTHRSTFEKRQTTILAVTLKESGQLIGCMSIDAIAGQKKAELGYWIGEEFWGKGYGTEAAREIVKYGFDVLKLNKIQARHSAENPASGKIMLKIGMEKEGFLKADMIRFDQVRDTVVYGLLNKDLKR